MATAVIAEPAATTEAELGVRHESAHLHVTGRACYADDIPLPANALHAAFALSRIAHGRIREVNIEALDSRPGVFAVAAAADVPGDNNYGSVLPKVPNTSASAASASADLNGKAAQAAAQTIRGRLTEFACARYGVLPHEVRFAAGFVTVGTRRLSFAALVHEAYQARISLSATGFYRTPKIQWDKTSMRGRPFFYFAYGAAVSEVAVDSLTGETQLLSVDILHDVGSSLNPAIDRGQIEGGFLQGCGWLTSEELWWNERGELKVHAPSTYKIPSARDWPARAKVELLQGEANREDTIYRSKAVGEPPLMLAMSVFHAIRDAIASAGRAGSMPSLTAPATPQAVLRAIEGLQISPGRDLSDLSDS